MPDGNRQLYQTGVIYDATANPQGFGYVVSGTPVGGFWMTRAEDLYTKFKRPFWSQ